ncbi:MAG: hypothetical protein IPH07_26940 [Deltaproteobacteria bacterium]|nr:hypothetical protein [Deltaproteobacteria bacterium]MBK8240315.1 hypothetical protein [Deltaproteobacteria bacterium]MBK8718398.1 hypothetical protein [Deltaproteobacteria bacterium]MBP7290414.1 hypothetical protein [Nannocystaceae bacterium]
MRSLRPRWLSIPCLLIPLACHDAGDGAKASAEGTDSLGTTATVSATAGGGSSSDAGSDDGASASASASATASASAGDGTDGSGDSTSGTTEPGTTAASGDSGTTFETGGSSSGGDLQDGVLDVTFVAHDDCTFTITPPSIAVPIGTEFTVNWISSAASVVEADIAKIDQFNQVPIIIGMEPGTSYHDEVRVWCGELFTGTFDFRLTSCYDPVYLPVDCDG